MHYKNFGRAKALRFNFIKSGGGGGLSPIHPPPMYVTHKHRATMNHSNVIPS